MSIIKYGAGIKYGTGYKYGEDIESVVVSVTGVSAESSLGIIDILTRWYGSPPKKKEQRWWEIPERPVRVIVPAIGVSASARIGEVFVSDRVGIEIRPYGMVADVAIGKCRIIPGVNHVVAQSGMYVLSEVGKVEVNRMYRRRKEEDFLVSFIISDMAIRDRRMEEERIAISLAA